MECKFCGETWHTAGRKGTRSRFSLVATLIWAFWLAIILLAACKVLDFMGVRFSGPKESPAKNASVIVVPEETANGVASGGESLREPDSKAASESGESSAPSDSK